MEAWTKQHGSTSTPLTPGTARHPALRTSKGTIQLREEDAADISDDELSDLVRAALEA
jgi:hypothetical protein